ncbi:hypothetical protein AAVH_26157 [Aphelenchoides avenae]|nr:hypothetical protein AAVH_26157 [Aphelenchus avenae]
MRSQMFALLALTAALLVSLTLGADSDEASNKWSQGSPSMDSTGLGKPAGDDPSRLTKIETLSKYDRAKEFPPMPKGEE